MKGLILKDFINLKQQAKIYLLIIAVWLVLALTNKDSAFFGGAMMIFSILIPITSIAYDEKAKWDKYALSMPIKRRDVVLSKYVLAFFCAFVGAILSGILSIAMAKPIGESVYLSMIFGSLGLMISSFILPLIFKFGVEKGRMLMLIVILVPTMIGLFFQNQKAPMPTEAELQTILNFAPLIALFVVAISIALSIKIYNTKEF